MMVIYPVTVGICSFFINSQIIQIMEICLQNKEWLKFTVLKYYVKYKANQTIKHMKTLKNLVCPSCCLGSQKSWFLICLQLFLEKGRFDKHGIIHNLSVNNNNMFVAYFKLIGRWLSLHHD